jgi:hypothetical protein
MTVMQTARNKNRLTPCQQEIFDLVSGRLALSEPTIIIINAEPGSGLSTLMEKLTESMGAACLSITSRPAISGLNLLEAFYYGLGLGGKYFHRAPLPAFISPLIRLQPIINVLVEDLDDFSATIPMKKTTIGHLSKIASALPDISLIVTQTLSRWDRGYSIHHHDICGAQERNEYYLRSFSGLEQYIEHFQNLTASIGSNNVSDLVLTKLYEITEGNLASTMLHLYHPLLKRKQD